MVRWRLRPSLRWTRVLGKWNEWWILSNPLTGEHFRCAKNEALVLRMLDGSNSEFYLKEAARLQKHKNLTVEDMEQVIGFARQANLVVQSEGLGANTVENYRGTHSSSIKEIVVGLQRATGAIFYNQIRLGNPTRLVEKLAQYTNWIFTKEAISVWGGFILVSYIALCLQLANVDSAIWQSVWQLANLRDWGFWLQCVIVFVVTRLIHELAHAVSCSRLGGRCTEIGLVRVLCIAFPFVDVSDSWRMPKRIHRVAVSAAGVYAELIMCAFAVWIWILTPPGVIHTLALQVVAVTSIASLLFNANPLMRYDGYYILSELLEVPNPQQASQALWKSAFTNVLRTASGLSRLKTLWYPVGIKRLLSFYAVAVVAYRFVLALGILTGLLLTLVAWELAELGWTIVFVYVATVLMSKVTRPATRLVARVTQEDAEVQTNNRWPRIWQRCLRAFIWSIFLALLILGATLPMPTRFSTEGRVVTQGRQPLFVNVPNTQLHDVNVENGVNIQLANRSIERRLLNIQQKIQELDAKQKSLQHAAYYQPELIDRLSQLKTLQLLSERTYEFEVEQAKNYNISVLDGQTFLPASLDKSEKAYTPSSITSELTEVQSVSHTVLDSVTRGQRIDSGTALGYMVRRDRVASIETTVNQKQRADIEIGGRANVRLLQYPDRVFRAQVSNISQLISSAQINESDRLMDAQNALAVDVDGYQVELFLLTDIKGLDFVEDGAAEIVFAGNGKSILTRLCDYGMALTSR